MNDIIPGVNVFSSRCSPLYFSVTVIIFKWQMKAFGGMTREKLKSICRKHTKSQRSHEIGASPVNHMVIT